MITLEPKTIELIKFELENIHLKYQQPFNSFHEGLAVLREEYIELESEIFFGEKKLESNHLVVANRSHTNASLVRLEHKANVRDEAIQVAAMACRIIQELT